MKNIKSYSQFKVNEEFIGSVFKFLKGKLSFKYSKMFGSSKEADKIMDQYKAEISKVLLKKTTALKQYAIYIKSSKDSGESDENKQNQLSKNIDLASKNYDEQVKLIKKKFDIKFQEVVEGEKNPKIKNYINLKKIEMQQELLSQELNSLLGDELDEGEIDDPKFNDMIKSIKKKAKDSESFAKSQKLVLDTKKTGFDINKAKESADKDKIYSYEWVKSPFPNHKFERGEEITYFSVSNYKSSKDKSEYVGTKASVEEDIGERIIVKTEAGRPEISKKAVISSESYDRKVSEEEENKRKIKGGETNSTK